MLPFYLAADQTESGPNPVIPAVGELIVGLLTFGIVVYVLGKYAWPQMEATFQARRDAIEGGIKRAEEAQAEAQRLLGEYRQQLSEARTEAAQIRENARAEGQRIIEEMRVTAQDESARIVARGEEQLTVQRQQVVRELRVEIGTLATGLAERVVGETLADDPARQRTVDRFLDELDDMSRSVPAGVGAGQSSAADRGTGPADRGTGPADRGTGPADRGTGPADRGTGPADRGTGPADRGTGPADRGTGPADRGTRSDATPTGPTDGDSGAGPGGDDDGGGPTRRRG
jgi:F-type H+-transporting ATPase subunit b